MKEKNQELDYKINKPIEPKDWYRKFEKKKKS